MLEVSLGNALAFRGLYEKYKGPIMSYVRNMVRDNSVTEEVTQEVFLRVYRARARYNSSAKFSTWLWTIARNCALDHLRKKKESYTEDLPESVRDIPDLDSLSDPEAALLEASDKQMIQRLIDKLSPAQREALSLRTFGEMSYDEIAETMEISVGAVKTHIHRAKNALIAELKPGGLDEK